MKARMHNTADQIMACLEPLVNSLVEEAASVCDEGSANALELRLRTAGLAMLNQWLESLLQMALELQCESDRCCDSCGTRRHHKGRRSRDVLTVLGPIRLASVYWRCPNCGRAGHGVDRLSSGTTSRMMQEMLSVLGVSLASFDSAERVSERVLGVKVDAERIRQQTQETGRAWLHQEPEPLRVPVGEDLVGSCDGTMVHLREEGWRELKALRFDHVDATYGDARVEGSDAFAPRIRDAAIALGASQAGRLFFVTDGAEWIGKAARQQLPPARHILDIYHTFQHVHEAGRLIYGQDDRRALQWSKRWCEEIRLRGAQTVWNRMRRIRFKRAEQQEALEQLMAYLHRHANQMDYPRYLQRNEPISSGPMESFCKQLGRRLKGPGMRWAHRNINPMAALTSAWTTKQWPKPTKQAA